MPANVIEAGDPVGSHFRKTTPALQPAACCVLLETHDFGISRLTGLKYKQMKSKISLTGRIGSQKL